MTQPLSYEQAFSRLEKILEQMNSGKIALEDALKLYEEAETLMQHCSQSLTQAERKIEQLMKNRDGSLALNADGSPLSASFESAGKSGQNG